MMRSFITHGTCSRKIDFEIENGVITHCEFHGGCPGNTTGVARLVIGHRPEEIIALLKDVVCTTGGRGVTSCPAQLAQALQEALDEDKAKQD